jgi:hypothetical protein
MATRPDDRDEVTVDQIFAYIAVAFATLTVIVPAIVAALR